MFVECAGAQNDKGNLKLTKSHCDDQFAIRKEDVKRLLSLIFLVSIFIVLPIIMELSAPPRVNSQEAHYAICLFQVFVPISMVEEVPPHHIHSSHCL